MNKDYFNHFDFCEGAPPLQSPSSASSLYESPPSSAFYSQANSEQPRQVLRTYTRVTTTDPRTGQTTTVIQDEANYNQQ